MKSLDKKVVGRIPNTYSLQGDSSSSFSIASHYSGVSNRLEDCQSVEQFSIIFDISSGNIKSQAISKRVTRLNHGAKITAGAHNMSLSPSQSTSTKASKLGSRIIWKRPIPNIDWTELHQTISLRGLLALASQLRDGKDCAFALESDTKPFSGGQSIIFVVEYLDSIKFAFRLPYHTRKFTIRDSLFSEELEKWKALISNRIPLVHKIFGFDLSDDNLIGFPFIAYEWVEGKPLLWNDDEPCDQTHREKIITTLASFTIDTACQLQKPGKFWGFELATRLLD